MTSQSVIEKRVVVIDGREHIISSTSWTQSINEAKKTVTLLLKRMMTLSNMSRVKID